MIRIMANGEDDDGLWWDGIDEAEVPKRLRETFDTLRAAGVAVVDKATADGFIGWASERPEWDSPCPFVWGPDVPPVPGEATRSGTHVAVSAWGRWYVAPADGNHPPGDYSPAYPSEAEALAAAEEWEAGAAGG